MSVTATRRTFWWDRARPLDTESRPLRAVFFDVAALADPGDDTEPRPGLLDLAMSLFVAGVWMAAVGTGRRAAAQDRVRQLVGEGLAETIVSADDLTRGCDTELFRLALWELGIGPGDAIAVVGSARTRRAATAVGLPTLPGDGCAGLLVEDCRRLHRRWQSRRSAAA